MDGFVYAGNEPVLAGDEPVYARDEPVLAGNEPVRAGLGAGLAPVAAGAGAAAGALALLLPVPAPAGSFFLVPELTWLGKDASRHHHLEVPYRPFVPTARFVAPGTPEGAPLHRIIHGGNLDALKNLLPEFAGRVKRIYPTPPYTVGNEQRAYAGNVSARRLLAWLGRTVGKEADGLWRHDKWRCMRHPRLPLLRQLLADDGALRTAPTYALPARRVALRVALPLPRSLYEREEDGTAPERAMMQLLADADNVTFWTRNPASAAAGFRLNGPLANHYPDFIAHTASGKVLRIETKGDDRNNEDSAYKRRLGAAWATAAGPVYRYYMVFDQLAVAGAQRLGTFAGLLAQL